jgi:hypothetical protein
MSAQLVYDLECAGCGKRTTLNTQQVQELERRRLPDGRLLVTNAAGWRLLDGHTFCPQRPVDEADCTVVPYAMAIARAISRTGRIGVESRSS